MTLITLEGVTKGFNDRVLLKDVSMALADGERVGLLGPNGSGKSTLLRILMGLEPPDEGSRIVKRGLRLGYLEQDPHIDPDTTARDAVRAGLGDRERVLADLERIHTELGEAHDAHLQRLLTQQSDLEHQLERLGGYEVEHRIEAMMLSLGLLEFDAPCGRLSGGERRRVALAQLLLGGPELLLLDEPTNHLDALVTEWLENWFIETKTPLLLVTHDRYFLDRVVDRILELDRGELVSYKGGYGEYLEARTARLDREKQTESSRQNLLRRETAWMRRGPPARTTKSKARIQRYEKLVDSGVAEIPADLLYEIPSGPRLGARVVEVSGITKSYDGRVVVPPLDLELGPGTRLGIVGPNGAGKTTLLKMLLGELEPDSGERRVGETVRFMGIDQQRSELDPDLTVAETIAGKSGVVKVGDRTVRAESFLDKWGFPARMHNTPIRRLSGGERSRVLLAKLLSAGGNVIFLDEPTNDLDLSTLRALEEALLAFPGSAVVVSHDRWFLDRVATMILYLDGQGGARLHHGDVSGLLETLARERAAAKPAKARKAESAAVRDKPASKPKRITPWQLKELEGVETRISDVETEMATLDERLADPALYTGPKSEVDAVQESRATLDGQLTTLYERWEELEALRNPSS